MQFTEQEKKVIGLIKALCEERRVTNKALAAYLGISGNVVTEWFGGRCRSFMKYTHAIAAFFFLPVEVLQSGELSETTPIAPSNEDALKIALFGGDGEVTDEMWEEVKNFAAYVKSKHSRS